MGEPNKPRPAPYLERIDDEDGTIRFEIHSAHEEDGWMIVFDERNDHYAKEHADMMMEMLLQIWPKQFARLNAPAPTDALKDERAEFERKLIKEEKDHERTIDQRDAAEEALGRAFQAATGSQPEWSNHFDYDDAVAAIEEAVAAWQARASASGLSRPGEGDWVLVPRERLKKCTDAFASFLGDVGNSSGSYEWDRVDELRAMLSTTTASSTAPSVLTEEEMAVLWKAVTLLKEAGYHIPAGQLYEVIARAFPDSTKETKS
jgi:hypothetical protein